MQSTQSSEVITLGSDSPQTDPMRDSFGYASFAKLLAKAVCTTPEPHGLVMSIHGPWGSGKSTLLNFIKYYIKDTDPNILIIDFNPWWFNDRDHLAAQFMKEFQKKLDIAPGKIREIGKLMGDYADELATLATNSAGVPYLSKGVSWFLKKIGKEDPKDIPSLKKKVSDALKKGDQRILFLIDDIDRLTPDEIREVFKVIKALADFPNVVYLTSFDKEVVSKALTHSLGVDGSAYLEKIIQASFDLPLIDRDMLRQVFFDDLDRLLQNFPSAKFSAEYWQNTFIEGIDGYLKKPRDIVRLANSLRTTYPPLSKEVNFVDFVAIEVLRLFEPVAYNIIRDNPSEFTGYRDQNRDPNDGNRSFHDTWLASIQGKNKQKVLALLSNLFPKFASSFGEAGHDAGWTRTWRNDLRICVDELFPVYFQFSISTKILSRAELMSFVDRAKAGDDLRQILLEADKVISNKNTPRSKEYLFSIREFDEELNSVSAINILKCLYQIGDKILDSPETNVGMTSLPRHWAILSTVDHLLGYVDENDRHRVLREHFTNGDALGLAVFTTERIANYLEKQSSGRDSALAQLTKTDFDEFKAIIYDRFRRTESAALLDIADLNIAMFILARWGYEADVREKVTSLFTNTYHIPKAVDRFMHVGHSYIMGRPAVRRIISFDPKNVQSLMDLDVVEQALQTMLLRQDLSSDQRAAGESFVTGMQKLRNGIDPDANDE